MIYIKDMDMPVDCLACRISCQHESYRLPGRPKECPMEEAKTGDLISRADAIEAVCGDCTIENRESCKRDGYCYEVRNLMALPSAETVQGEWGHMIAHGTDGSHWYEYECSHCGEVVLRPYNFCPNCGARMKGGEQNDD